MAMAVAAVALVLFTVAVAGCTQTVGEGDPDIEAARSFDGYPLYWVGEHFEQWDLEHADASHQAKATERLGRRLGLRIPALARPVPCAAAAPCSYPRAIRPVWRQGRVQAASSAFDHDGGLYRTAARMQPVGYEQAVEELNRDRALSNCRRHALHGTVSNVAGRENPRHARLEQKRTAIERPRVVVAKIRSREDETPRIPLDLRWQPLSVRARSDHEEEPVGVDGLLASLRAITKHEVLQPPAAAAADDLRPETELELRRRLHLANQVPRHPGAERLSAHHERDAPCVAGEVQRSLSS